MKLYKPSELKEYLASIGASPKKRFSQNFLIDQNIIEKILTSSDVTRGDCVLEIGPGPGVLTHALLNRDASVFAIEKDPVFAAALPKNPLLTTVEADFLELDLEVLFSKSPSKVKVVANLPYGITTLIFEKLLLNSKLFFSLTLMVQKEFSERLFSKNSANGCGPLSLIVDHCMKLTSSFPVSPTCFFPPPRVHSVVLSLVPLETEIQKITPAFFNFLRHVFSMRRKMIRASVGKLYPQPVLQHALLALSISENARPDTLSFTQLHDLFSLLESTE